MKKEYVIGVEINGVKFYSESLSFDYAAYLAFNMHGKYDASLYTRSRNVRGLRHKRVSYSRLEKIFIENFSGR